MKFTKFTSALLVTVTLFSSAVQTDYIYGQSATAVTLGQQKVVDTKKVYRSREELLAAVNIALTLSPKKYTLKISGISEKDITSLNANDYFSDIDSSASFIAWGSRNGIPTSVEFEVKDFIGHEIKAVMEGRKNRSDLSKEANAVYDKTQSVLASYIKSGMTDYDKALAIHDYIVLNTAYDDFNLQRDTLPESAFDVEGVMLKGSAVCEGYAETFKMFMDILGVECHMVGGSSKNTPHAWNVIKLDGQWYYVDVTWDDPVPDTPGYVSYEYFNITEAQLKEDHVWNNKLNIVANSSNHNYYVKNGMAAYNEAEARAIATKAVSEGKTTFTIYTFYNTNADTLGDMVMNVSNKGCRILYSDRKYTFTLVN